MKGLFIASTGQNIGKTTTALGLFSGLSKRFSSVGYMKPVGQEHVETKEGISVDKDVLLFKEHFHIKDRYADMSPLLVPSGFTRSFLDGKIGIESLEEKIIKAYGHIAKNHDRVIVEGTGHCGVGSIINLNNAQAAKLLNLPIVLVASGGLGSAFDELTLNKSLCDKFGVNIIGVILNRVRPEKKEMIFTYMGKALKEWNIPLLGCIPLDSLLSNPSMKDLEGLFKTTLLTCERYRMRHFTSIHLVATSIEAYRESIVPKQLLITPASHEDIILATLTKHWEYKNARSHEDFQSGMILTGEFPPRHFILEEITKADIPMLYTPFHSDTVIQMINSFTAKIRTEDTEKVKEAIHIVESHIDFKLLQLN